jgi:triacylglycerol lipase
MFPIFIIFLWLSLVSGLDTLMTGVWLSGAAYCPKELYPMMDIGPVDFVYNATLHNGWSDLQGFVGRVLPGGEIWVVFRGSSSVRNWIHDLEVAKVGYATFPECGCSVHRGFYESVLGVREDALTAVAKLIADYPGDRVFVTGHSYGAACAQFMAMELAKGGIPADVYTYGSPRVGDSLYSSFMTLVLNHVRVTHSRDIVPHVPPKEMGFFHGTQEWFESEDGVLVACSDIDGEDPACSGQYALRNTTVDDHLVYLGHPVTCYL